MSLKILKPSLVVCMWNCGCSLFPLLPLHGCPGSHTVFNLIFLSVLQTQNLAFLSSVVYIKKQDSYELKMCLRADVVHVTTLSSPLTLSGNMNCWCWWFNQFLSISVPCLVICSSRVSLLSLHKSLDRPSSNIRVKRLTGGFLSPFYCPEFLFLESCSLGGVDVESVKTSHILPWQRTCLFVEWMKYCEIRCFDMMTLSQRSDEEHFYRTCCMTGLWVCVRVHY